MNAASTGSARVLVLIRGNGFGHAARMRRVLTAINRQAPWLNFTIAAGGDAGSYLRQCDDTFMDLRWPDEADHDWFARNRVRRLIAANSDSACAVIVDELAYVPAIAVRNGLPTVYFACNMLGSRYSGYLSSVAKSHLLRLVVPDWRQFHDGPVDDRVSYVGPIVAAEECSLPPDRTGDEPGQGGVLVAVGGEHPTKVAIRDQMVTDAVRVAMNADVLGVNPVIRVLGQLSRSERRFIPRQLSARVSELPFTPDVAPLYSSASLVLAYGGASACEGIASGRPTVVYSPSGHPYDKARADWFISNNYGLSPDWLRQHISDRATLSFGTQFGNSQPPWCNLSRLAGLIIEHIHRKGSHDGYVPSASESPRDVRE